MTEPTMKTITLEIPNYENPVLALRGFEMEMAEQTASINKYAMEVGTSIPEQIGTYLVELLKPFWEDGSMEKLIRYYKAFDKYAEYENGDSFYFHGWDEEDCMYSIAEIADDYDTECTYYTCVNDSCHYDGEYYKEGN